MQFIPVSLNIKINIFAKCFVRYCIKTALQFCQNTKLSTNLYRFKVNFSIHWNWFIEKLNFIFNFNISVPFIKYILTLWHPWVKSSCNYVQIQLLKPHKFILNSSCLANWYHNFVMTVKKACNSEKNLITNLGGKWI